MLVNHVACLWIYTYMWPAFDRRLKESSHVPFRKMQLIDVIRLRYVTLSFHTKQRSLIVVTAINSKTKHHSQYIAQKYNNLETANQFCLNQFHFMGFLWLQKKISCRQCLVITVMHLWNRSHYFHTIFLIWEQNIGLVILNPGYSDPEIHVGFWATNL